MSIISLATIDEAPLERDPFDFLVIKGAIKPETLEALNKDYPEIDKPTNFLPIKKNSQNPNRAIVCRFEYTNR